MMHQISFDARVHHGQVKLMDMPFADETEVKVIVIPKVDLGNMSFPKIRGLTKSIPGGLSEDVTAERCSE